MKTVRVLLNCSQGLKYKDLRRHALFGKISNQPFYRTHLCLFHVCDGEVREVLRGVRAHLRDPQRVPLERRLHRLQELQQLAQANHRCSGMDSLRHMATLSVPWMPWMVIYLVRGADNFWCRLTVLATNCRTSEAILSPLPMNRVSS